MNVEHWRWPQYVLVGWLLTKWLVHVIQHGKPLSTKESQYDGFNAVLFVISAAWILYAGGYFN